MADPLTVFEGIPGVSLERDASLAEQTTLKVGGPARALLRVDDPVALPEVVRRCAESELPVLVLGRGSNLLIADGGWDGVALTLGRGFRGVEIEGTRVTAGAAEPMPVLAEKVSRAGLAGLAFGIAIPGTLGGAVRMNAGAHGRELRDVLVDADVVRIETGAQERWDVPRLEMSYRHTALPAGAVVVRARLELTAAPIEEVREEMREMRAWRREHQPISEPSCGSVFRNPEGDAAGRLIEAAGLKGRRRGNAAISEKHANFITVEPGARADDVHGLIREVQAEVRARFGVDLETEVVLVGFGQERP